MEIALVAAASENNIIGKDGDLPWKLPADLAHFKRITKGHPVIMGRKTFESIGRPLPKRMSIVVTRNRDFFAEGCEVAHSVEEAIKMAQAHDDERICIIGGEGVYRQAMPFADTIYLTRVHENFDGDTRFPEIDASEWDEVSREKGVVDEDNPHPHTFITYRKNAYYV